MRSSVGDVDRRRTAASPAVPPAPRLAEAPHGLVHRTVRVPAEADAGERRAEGAGRSGAPGADPGGSRKLEGVGEARRTGRRPATPMPPITASRTIGQRLEELERRRADRSELGAVEGAAEPGDGGRQREHLDLGRGEVDAERGARRRRRLHGQEAPAELAAAHADDQGGHEAEHDAEEHEVGAVAVGGDRPEIEARHRPVAVGHEQVLVEEDLVHEHGERGRGQGEVEALEPKGGKRHHDAGRSRRRPPRPRRGRAGCRRRPTRPWPRRRCPAKAIGASEICPA